MATYDVLDVVRGRAAYMIASEELVPSSGWDYKALIENLGKEGFYQSVLDSYAEKHNNKTFYTLSAIKLAGMSEVDRILTEIIEKLDLDCSILADVLDDTVRFGANETNRYNTNLFDMGWTDIFECCINQINEEAHPEHQVHLTIKIKENRKTDRQ